ncbi:MAG: ABC transporter substrate binding protein [Gammaproteobacteria bacterium]|nr:ABC transporter substrate binding protein [Gammaproteobacteria bacterium]
MYRQVEDALIARLERPSQVYRLDVTSPESVRDALAGENFASVIAIGQGALAAVDGTGLEVIHAQIFKAPTGEHRGVAAIPPFEMQLAYWKSLSPDLERVGVIASSNMRAVVDSLAKAAAEQGIDLLRSEVKSDKEMLFEFRRMVLHIDGFVFLPDDAVLSPYVIRRVMQHSVVNQKQILTYSAAMFRLGAFLYVTPVQDEVAARIVTLLEDPERGAAPLTMLRARVQGRDGYVDVSG